jgi:hypothetical protein
MGGAIGGESGGEGDGGAGCVIERVTGLVIGGVEAGAAEGRNFLLYVL